jgi:signal transduction histidine kinase
LTTTAAMGTKSERTEVLYGEKRVAKTLSYVFSGVKKNWHVCADFTAPSVIVEQLKDGYFDFKDRGINVRFVTEITKHNVHYCKEMVKFITELRHLDGVKGNFGISDGAVYVAVATMQEAKPVSQLIYSNAKQIVEQNQYLFETLWSRAIPAEQRIREVEEGIQPNVIEVINTPVRAKELYLRLLKTAKDEVLLMFPTANAFARQAKLGVVKSLIEAAKERKVGIRILIPASKLTETIIAQLNEEQRHQFIGLDIRYVEQTSDTKATILVVDTDHSLVMELKDDSKMNFDEAIGLSTYSNSKSSVLSYVSIFESLWEQTKLYERLKESDRKLAAAYEQLKIHDKMQKEFINIAAHELKTPTQAILGFSDLIMRYPKKRKELTEAIRRNATRLQRLTNDILDVTKIESRNLKLNIEQLNLYDLISNVAKDYKNQIEKSTRPKIKLTLNEEKSTNSKKNQIIVQADRNRLIQVISNLLNNAIKFRDKEGQEVSISISITTAMKNNEKKGRQKEEVLVRVKDTGIGISPDIIPRLFTKFASKSYQGTGLGLFISKNIVEAHGGRMWAENNAKERRGATFSFSLPLSKELSTLKKVK